MRIEEHDGGMRLREHHKGDLVLSALTLTVAAVTAGKEAVRWVTRHRRRERPGAKAT